MGRMVTFYRFLLSHFYLYIRGDKMGQKINEIGNIYGYLTVIAEGPRSKDNRATWLCRCKCGKEIIVAGKALRSGHT